MLYREKSLLAGLGGGLAPLQDALAEPGRDATARGEPGLFLTAVSQKAPCCSHSQPWKYENPLCGVGTGSSVREELLFYHLGLFQSLHHTALFFLPLAGQEQLQLLFFYSRAAGKGQRLFYTNDKAEKLQDVAGMGRAALAKHLSPARSDRRLHRAADEPRNPASLRHRELCKVSGKKARGE